MEYPYSSNLRLLLLLKTHLEGHPDEQNYLQRCASASFDRVFIYDLLQDLQRNNEEPREETEVLELRTLDEIALNEAALLADNEATAVATGNSLSYAEVFPDFETEEEQEDLLTAEPEATFEPGAVVPPYRMPGVWVATAADFLTVFPDWSSEATPAEAFAPEPVSKFSGGKRPEHGQSLKDRLRSIRRRQNEQLADEQVEVLKIARRSLVTKEAVASETLARLLVQQGQYQRAIKMYRSLELLYPEKKTIFASLIKELQEKL